MKTIVITVACFAAVAASYAQPVITNQPGQQIITAGEAATFCVGATGTEPLTYQWFLNTLANPIPDGTNSCLELTNVQSEDAGFYPVRVTDSGGSRFSISAALVVQPRVVNITDPVLESVLREALGGLTGDITREDMESLSQLEAWQDVAPSWAAPPSILSLEGLDTARNLTNLMLSGSISFDYFDPYDSSILPLLAVSDFSPLAGLSNLVKLDLPRNRLLNVSLPAGLTALETLSLDESSLTSLTLPPDMSALTTLDLSENRLTGFTLPDGFTNLTRLHLTDNQLTVFTLSDGLTSLERLGLSGNGLASLTLPDGFTNLTHLSLNANSLTTLTLPSDMSALINLQLTDNQLTDFTLPDGLTNLTHLFLNANSLTTLTLPSDMSALINLQLADNQLTDFTLPDGLTNLTWLYLSDNQLNSLTLGDGLSSLRTLDLSYSSLTNLTLPDGLTSLTRLDIMFSGLTRLALPAGLSSLRTLDLSYSSLTHLTLPDGPTSLTALDLSFSALTTLILGEGLTNLPGFDLDFSSLATVVVPEPLAPQISSRIEDFRSQGVEVYLYPLGVTLVAPHRTVTGEFEFALTGPPNSYRVQVTGGFVGWTDLDVVVNEIGTVAFTDPSTSERPSSFYRVIKMAIFCPSPHPPTTSRPRLQRR